MDDGEAESPEDCKPLYDDEVNSISVMLSVKLEQHLDSELMETLEDDQCKTETSNLADTGSDLGERVQGTAYAKPFSGSE
jgi:hypothetical protein